MNKPLLITGCTHGIGNALALRFAQAGFTVYAVGRDKKLLDVLSFNSHLIKPVVADITIDKDIIYKAVENEESISIIHNAGIVKPALAKAMSEGVLKEQFETNFFAPLLLTQELLPFLKKGSRVLHISSIAAELAIPGLMPYCASKAALEQATRGLNAELNPAEIYFANLRPGIVDTNMQKQLREEKEANLPCVNHYIEAKKNDLLASPALVADFIFWVMTGTPNEAFSQTLWNMAEPSYRQEWEK